MGEPRLVIAAGGTGGHMFPAQSLAEAMLRQGWRVTLMTDARGARYTGGFPHSVDIREIASATTALGGALGKITAPFKIGAGVLSAAGDFLKDRPQAVAGFGGYPSIPALAAAYLLGVPRLLHEQNGVLGRVNRVFAKRVQAVACGTWPTVLPAGVEGIPVGNPVRASVMERAGAPYDAPGDGGISLVVFGGSQGAQILSRVVPAAVGLLPEEMRAALRVTQQARPEDQADVSKAYKSLGISAEIEPFFHDLPKRIAGASLVISRAGASSVADISIIGRPSILIPFAAATADHQTYNARGLLDAEAAVLIPEAKLSPESLAEQIRAILANPEAAERMAANALRLARPDATDRLVALVEDIAGLTKRMQQA